MDQIPANETQTKWEIAIAAIQRMTTDFKGRLRFGIALFPDNVGPECTQDTIPLPIAANNESPISTLLQQTQIGFPCVTNIDGAMEQAAKDPALDDTGRRSFVLLITDGKQSFSCGGQAGDRRTIATIQQLYDRFVDTYVVGFGSQVDPNILNQFALAGGLPREGGRKYLEANNATELDSVLNQIGEQLSADELSCLGLPCPDNRCADSTHQCQGGFCFPPSGPSTDGGSAQGDGRDGNGPYPVWPTTACGVSRSGSRSTSGLWIAGLAILLLQLVRRRRP